MNRFLLGHTIVMDIDIFGGDPPQPADAALTVEVQPPGAPSYTVTPTDDGPLQRAGLARYTLKLTLDVVGSWVVRTITTGYVDSVREDTFLVDRSQITR